MNTSNEKLDGGMGWMRRCAAAWRRAAGEQRRAAAPVTEQEDSERADDARYWRDVYILTSQHY